MCPQYPESELLRNNIVAMSQRSLPSILCDADHRCKPQTGIRFRPFYQKPEVSREVHMQGSVNGSAHVLWDSIINRPHTYFPSQSATLYFMA